MTQPKHERLAAQFLAEREVEAFAPSVIQRKRLYDRTSARLVPLFPRYIFCRFDRNQILAVETTPGVTGIVRFGSRMAEIPDEQIEALMTAIASGAAIEPVDYCPHVGDRVLIESGMFRGQYGRVERLKGHARLILSVDILQRSVAVEIETDAVSKAA